MRRVIERTLIAFGVLTTAACTLAGPGVSPYGRLSSIYPVQRPASSGELIAVNADSIWLLRRDSLLAFGMAGIRGVEVQRHRFTAKRTLLVSVVAGVVSGAALTLACSSVEDAEGCGGVFPAMVVATTALGGVLAIGANASSKFYFAPHQWSDMRGFARFPQGMPDSARATQVLVRPSGVLRR
jgi:hypothetical protein